MTCHNCRTECKRKGHDRHGRQRFQCRQCSKTFLEPREDHLGGMYTPIEKAEVILSMLILEGSSIATVSRVTGAHPGTIAKLLVLAGEKAERVMAKRIVNVKVRDLEMNEVWSFVGKKQKRVRPDDDQNMGDCYPSSPLNAIPRSWLTSPSASAISRPRIFSWRAFGRRQRMHPSRWTTDGFAPYRSAIVTTLHDRLTGFAQLIKVYRAPQDGEKRYSPAEVQSVEVVPVYGQPDPERICTSIVDRSNLSLRMGVRRFTRLTNAFSKKWENHAAAVMLWFAFYNFCRVHKSLKVTPAMEAGVSDHIWSVRELLTA